MGTNYYWNTGPITRKCTDCGHPHECMYGVLHIGKASAGWTFLFKSQPGIQSTEDWKTVTSGKGIIEDEYGVQLSHKEFWDMVIASSTQPKSMAIEYPDDNHLDNLGYSFSKRNFS